MTGTNEALLMVLAMGAIIVFCRAFPFLFFGRKGEKAQSSREGLSRGKIFDFIEKIVPPVAMTVLAFNALGGAFRKSLPGGTPALAAALFTAILHLWKRNTLISIIGGTALYMILTRVHLF